MSVVEFRRPSQRLYEAKSFSAAIGGAEWRMSGTLCGNIDLATPAGTFCLSPDEAQCLIASLAKARTDVLENSGPQSDPRLYDDGNRPA